MLQQTTGITCAPAAAAMMLYQSGIRVSEGELAELAGTNPLQGTAPYALARAVDCVARRSGKRGCVRRVDYAQVSLLGRPFVAFMNRPGVGGHALCVARADATAVEVIDPLSGSEDRMTREEFTAEWDPVIVWVDGKAAQRALRRARTTRRVVYCPSQSRQGRPVREVAEFATTGC
jgi:ABC-type bacteriocin/lantibiotic exporter with double-glycine peptidase domain